MRRDEGSVRERSKGRWEIRVELGRGPDGKRKRKIIQFRGNKTEANRKLRELLTSLDKGIPLGTQKITFGQWLAKWMRDYVVHKRQKTIERYEGLIAKHIDATGSTLGLRVLERWDDFRPAFVKVMPIEYKRALAEMAREHAEQSAEMAVSHG